MGKFTKTASKKLDHLIESSSAAVKEAEEAWRASQKLTKLLKHRYDESKSAHSLAIRMVSKAHDPKSGKPRPPKTAHQLFSKDLRQKARDELEEGAKLPSMTDMNKVISAKWNAVKSDEESETFKHYRQLAAEDKERYARELAEYEAKQADTVASASSADAAVVHPPEPVAMTV